LVQVLAAQTRLAQGLRGRLELYEVYLIELLALFADKAVAIQNVAISDPHMKVLWPHLSTLLYTERGYLWSQMDGMIEQLASLLLPIDALLAHADFNPQKHASSEIVTLFRNMWFLCVLFNFTSNEEKEDSAMEWQKPALARIAAKTPFLVLEEAHDFSIFNELEYNSVIRQEYAHSVSRLPYTRTNAFT
jgi:phosphatidylinositol 4-kinase A